jgi:cytochrome bd-I ubiquinol oxidase subunit X
MWYFSWILGLGLACSFGILNAMWFEMREDRRLATEPVRPGRSPPP